MQISTRKLVIGAHTLAREGEDLGTAPYLIAGPQLYVIGRGSSELLPLPSEHIPGEMGGIWAHPLKVAEGLLVVLADDEGRPLETHNAVFEECLSNVQWHWRCAELTVERRDAVALIGSPALLSQISIQNQGATTANGELQLRLDLKFIPAWRSGMHSGGGLYGVDGAYLLGRDKAAPDQWGLACSTGTAPDSYRLEQRDAACEATLIYRWALAPGEQRHWLFVLVAESERGADHARQTCATVLRNGEALLLQQTRAYEHTQISIVSPDADLTRDVILAQANLRLLEANYPALGPYFLAGLPEYPQLFGCDTTYSVPGALAGGFVEPTRNAMLRLAEYAQRACARVPHELTTNGRIFHPGNVQETPQYVVACWDFVRWTGDLEFGRSVFALCREATDEFLPMMSWPDGFYPYGDGMVERLGMGARKLDSVCYHYAALLAVAELAAALDEQTAAEGYRVRAAALKQRFVADWWLEDEGLYADSMHTDGRLQFDGHWTVVLPLQVGLAEGERAERMWARIEAEWVNEWGLVHTREREDRVWTLPTGLLALAAFEHGRGDLGLRLVQNIALTARTGTLGTFKELIPEGLCFVQLWSAALYLQGVVEGLLGVRPLAHRHRLELQPRLPAEWGEVSLHGLRVGEHTLNLQFAAGTLMLEHVAGNATLSVLVGGTELQLPPGSKIVSG